jgi:DHA1 family multidrug resistance protein-like MFS transporter
MLNFGIYIGSSIYTPGELGIIQEFGVSEVVATLGLSLFVL